MEPVISRLTYSQHKRLDDAAPNRQIGMEAAWDYLQNSKHVITTPIIVPIIGIILLVIGGVLLVWGRG